jgi:hypothetical protein
MSEVITAILKCTFGLISTKLSCYGAETLQDGGLADQTFRGWIVRELDDIKFKLDAISRKDLCMSISCLQQGIKRLMISSGNPSTSEWSQTNGKPPQTKPAQSVNVEDAVALVNVIGKMKMESNQRFKSAKQSFTVAGEKAGEAFHNAALSINDRVLASKVRIASGILENIDDPQVAASDCLHYLQELHNMPGIKEIFSVHLQGGIKSLFKKDSRGEMVDTITRTNLLLAGFISKFTKRRMGVFDWPMIECGKQVIHPIHYKKESVQKMREMEITPPWDIIIYKKPIDKILEQNFSINSKEDIVGVFDGNYHPQKLDRATGEWQPCCLSPSDDKTWYSRSAAIDDNNTMYVVSCECGSDNSEDTLSVYHSDGTILYHCPLNFTKEGVLARIAITKDKKIVFCSFKGLGCSTGTLYVCNINGELIASFPIHLNSEFERVWGLFVSGDKSTDEITVATGSSDAGLLLYVYTQDGGLKRIVKLHHASPRVHYKISFDHVTKNYIVCSADLCNNIVHVECISETGEVRNSLFLDRKYIIDYEYIGFLISHINGAIALVNSNCAFYLQSSLM